MLLRCAGGKIIKRDGNERSGGKRFFAEGMDGRGRPLLCAQFFAHALKNKQEHTDVDGLKKVVKRFHLQRVSNEGIIVVTTENQYFAGKQKPLDLMQKSKPIHGGHFDIRDHQIDRNRAQDFKRLPSIGCFQNRMGPWKMIQKDLTQPLQNIGIIIRD